MEILLRNFEYMKTKNAKNILKAFLRLTDAICCFNSDKENEIKRSYKKKMCRFVGLLFL